MPLWLRATIVAYPWRRVNPVPLAPLRRPLRRCRVALVSTAGLVPPGAPPFDSTVRGGDWTFRVVPSDQDVPRLTESHRSWTFDHTGVEADPNVGLPLDGLRALARDGVVGSVAPRHLSFMGSITAPGRLIRKSAPEAAGLLVDDAVDIALLVPV